MELTQKETDSISQIVADHGYIEWNLIAFTPKREYNIYSYFTDPSIMPIFRGVILSILNRLDRFCIVKGKETWH
jgi:hypothetical protein